MIAVKMGDGNDHLYHWKCTSAFYYIDYMMQIKDNVLTDDKIFYTLLQKLSITDSP